MKNNDQSDQSEALAAMLLWSEAHKLLTKLENMAQKHPDLFRLVARKTFYWPGFVSRKRAFDTKYAELMDKIELGVDCPYSPKQWQISAPTTRTAMELHLYCCRYEKEWELPPLTKKTKRSWFERAWQYMVDDLHVVPENHPVLAALGKSAERYYYKREDPKERTPRAARAEIKRQIWKAFDKLIFLNS